MRISKKKLKKIIKEELQGLLQEGVRDWMGDMADTVYDLVKPRARYQDIKRFVQGEYDPNMEEKLRDPARQGQLSTWHPSATEPAAAAEGSAATLRRQRELGADIPTRTERLAPEPWSYILPEQQPWWQSDYGDEHYAGWQEGTTDLPLPGGQDRGGGYPFDAPPSMRAPGGIVDNANTQNWGWDAPPYLLTPSAFWDIYPSGVPADDLYQDIEREERANTAIANEKKKAERIAYARFKKGIARHRNDNLHDRVGGHGEQRMPRRGPEY